MNQTEQKRNQRAEQLRVFHVDEEDFWVESSDGKIAYHTIFSIERGVGKCTCPDYQTRIKSDGDFKCKHILAVADAIINSDVEGAEYLEKMKPKLDDRFLSNIQGKDFVIYSGLLDLAHQNGLVKLEVKTLQLPTKDNGFEAICHAIAETKYGEVYADVGDANPKNVNTKIAAHIIRMASTRSKARCLRDMTNIGITCLEELGDLSEVIGSSDKVVNIRTRKPAQAKKVSTAKTVATDKSNGNGVKKKTVSKPKVVEKVKSETKKSDNGNGSDQPKMSVAQNRALMNLSRRRGISVDELEKMSKEMFNSKVENLSTSDAASFIRNLQQSA